MTLIDAAPHPFDALMGPGLGARLRELHERAGVRLALGRRLVAAVAGRLELDDGTRVPYDHVLVAVGVRPDTAWTGLSAPVPGVCFAGDASGSAHWEAAARQGAAAARSMLGLPLRPEAPPLVWSDQHGVRIQRLGDPRGARLEAATDDAVFTYVRAGRPAAVVLIDRPGAVGAARRLLANVPDQEAA